MRLAPPEGVRGYTARVIHFSRCAWFVLLAPLVSVACSAPAPDATPTAPAVGTEQSAIFGGQKDSDASAHESVVMLFLNEGQESGSCTGSLIAPNLVLTARHCVSKNIGEGIGCDPDGNSLNPGNGDHVSGDFDPSTIGVYTGVSPKPWSEQPKAVGKKIFHPDGNNLCNHDIALILLDQSVETPAGPMKLRLNFGPQMGEKTTPVGYGKTTSSDFSAGTRYRRENVTVLSVGRDFNYYLGENEFLMGQSICQGDSGGPVLAGDSGAVIGVTSRGADCNGDDNRFTRVDAHKDLIQQALAEAGASAQLEGKTAPKAVTPIKTGEGPCTTGSECADDFCFAGTCNQVCNAGTCPDDAQSCQLTTATIAGQLINDVPVCQPFKAVDDCDTCRHDKCQVRIEACRLNSDCKPMADCVAKCTTPDCYDACGKKYPKGLKAYEQERFCECKSKCDTQCAGVCGNEVAAGAGGESGAGGSGGSGEAGSDVGQAGDDSQGQGGDDGQGGSGAAGVSTSAGGTSGTPATQPSTSSDGGCSTSGAPAQAGGWLLVGLLGLAGRRRRAA